MREALALAAYLADPDWPVVRTLVCDDAPQFRAITEALALCWIHEGRHFKKLTPYLPQYRAALADILTQFWDFYRDLLAYREQPTPEACALLDASFDTLFGTKTGYQVLDQRLALTLDKKPELLLVLDHPELPLHNNPAELGARQRVRKRDVSFGPRSPARQRRLGHLHDPRGHHAQARYRLRHLPARPVHSRRADPAPRRPHHRPRSSARSWLLLDSCVTSTAPV